MRKQGQAAMEFLMTYGWAILVVLAAIAALAYFGVLSPNRFVPDRCMIQGEGISCLNSGAVSSTGVIQLELSNGGGVAIALTEATITPSAGCAAVSTTTDLSTPLVVADGARITLNFQCEDGAAAAVTPAAGTKLRSDVVVRFTKDGSSIANSASGTLTKTFS